MLSQHGKEIRKVSATIIQDPRFDILISCVIILNCIVLGIQTFALPSEAMFTLNIVDAICLVIYTAEIGLRFISNPATYFRSGWNIFDLVVVVLSILPMLVPFPAQITRIIRIFRTLRILLLVSALEPLRRIITSLVRSLPGIFWTVFLLGVICYIYGIAGFYLFGQDFPEYFGDLGSTLFTLFQLTTLENWAEIARDVMAVEPSSAFYFISFVLIAAFIMVNVVVGVIVSNIEEAAKSENSKSLEA